MHTEMESRPEDDHAPSVLEQAKKLALLYAQAHSKATFITCDSQYGNLIIPVLPFEQDEHSMPSTSSTGDASV